MTRSTPRRSRSRATFWFVLALTLTSCSESDRTAANASIDAAASDAANAARAVATAAASTTHDTVGSLRSNALQMENAIDTKTRAATPPAKNFALATAVKARLIGIDPASGSATNVVAAGDIVHLTGSVTSATLAKRFETAALGVPGVRHVASHLSVNPKLPSPVQPARDLALGAEVRANLAVAAGLDTAELDVTARDGIVTLAGAVANAALRARVERATRDTPGVTHVDDLLQVR